MDELRIVSGCAGIGGGDLGFKRAGFRTVCYIERESWCASILLDRMREGVLDTAPIWNDFTTFDGKPWRGVVDCFFAGIPCQPHSMAGKRVGSADERNLWPAMRRIIGEMEPRIVVVENVPGLFIGERAYGLVIVGELQSMGYVVAGKTLSAREVGAYHLRNRRFIIGFMADTLSNGQLCRLGDALSQGRDSHQEHPSESEGELADSKCGHVAGCRGLNSDLGCEAINNLQGGSEGQPRGMAVKRWEAEPRVGRVAHGVPHWVDRIKGLGNAIVPQVAEQIAKEIRQVIE